VYPFNVARTALLAGAVVLAVAAACSTQAQLAGAGAQCFAATDCQEGLFCLPQKGGTSICSNDTAAVQTVEDAAAGDGAPGDDGATTPMPDSGAAPDSAGTPDSSSTPDTSTTPDTSVPDTSTPDSDTTPDADMPDAAAD
jgi:hypothetical protein